MFNRCVFCHTDLPSNQSVEHFPVGRRIAYDPARGRLWVVCGSCRRWNLAPIEERWEVLEDLERLSRDRGRLLSQTEHIALFKAEDVELVRVGRAELAEEAWWRYGLELQRRRLRNQIVQGIEIAAFAGVMAASGGFLYLAGFRPIQKLGRWRKFGSTLWSGNKACAGCGRPMTRVTFDQSKNLILGVTADDQTELSLRCRSCGLINQDGGITFTGAQADRMLRRTLAYHNHAGASAERVKDAVQMIDHAGSPVALIRELGRSHYSVGTGKKRRGEKNPRKAIALEIALNDETERELLELELAELEARWREEEQLAAIVDGELTHVPMLERIRLKLPG